MISILKKSFLVFLCSKFLTTILNFYFELETCSQRFFFKVTNLILFLGDCNKSLVTIFVIGYYLVVDNILEL